MSGTSSNRLADKKGGRGSVNNQRRLAAFDRVGTEKRGNADWGGCDPKWVAAVVVQATAHGMEVSFALSRDGGAHSLKLFDFASGERVQLWFNGDAELERELAQVYEKLGGQFG